MFPRFREHLRREKELIAEAKADVYKEVTAWNRRLRESGGAW